jgi:type VI secretion system protein ImpL
MRKLLRIVLSRWVQTLVGTAMLAALVWVFGPLLPPLEPWLPRLLVIQSMLVVWAVANALIDAQRRGRDSALAAGLGGDAADAEATAVGRTLAEALRQMKRAGQRGTLFDQPWYAIIGPPGAGKTTALLNAGLTFTLAEQTGQAAVAGVGGTRLCEWWFTADAVLIDTAGRYTTQDSDAMVDRAGWEAFLDLLRRTRPGQPLNGIIVAIALPDIALADAAERDQHAATIQRRIDELQQRLGVHLPIYALFTKADLIAGFSEFFDNLDREQRDQVWGTTFAWAAGGVTDLVERFSSGFRGLVERLNERLIVRLQAEHRLERRGLIAGFPTQVASLEKPLAAFIAAAFAPPPSAGPAPLLRGVYFASGTQEGTPIDRLTGAMARAFGIDQARAAALRPQAGRSYFLGSLLRDVVFGEAMLVREAPGAARRRRAWRIAGLAAVGLVVLSMVGCIIYGRMEAGGQLAAVAAGLAAYEQSAQQVPLDPVADGDVRALAALLDRAAALQGDLPRGEIGIGMAQQTAKLETGIKAVYRNGLTFGLLPRLVWRLETQMRGALNRPDFLYGATRITLMLGGVGKLNAGQVSDWMAADWAQTYPAADDAKLRDALAHHLQALLALPLPAIGLDGALIARARAGIGQVPLADRVYGQIRAAAQTASVPPWRPIEAMGPASAAGAQIFIRASGRNLTDGVPGFYTPAGYRSLLLPALAAATQQVAGETWILGRKTDLAADEVKQLQSAVTALYEADFAQHWDAMLADLNIEAMTSLPQAAQDLYIMAAPESPLRALLKSLAAQLQPGPPEAMADGRLQHYRPLVDLVSGDGASLAHSLRLLADIQQELAKLAALPVGTPLPPGGEDLGAALLADAAHQPQPVARWLALVGAAAQALRTGNARRQAAIVYNAPGGPAQACRADTAALYPFAADGNPLLLDEFARLFAPGGLLDGFFNTQVKGSVDTSSKPWKPLAGDAAAAALSAGDIAQFQRAAAIRDAFFPAGQASPLVAFEIAPAGHLPDTVSLDIAGTRISADSSQTTQIVWPPPGGAAASASLSADPNQPKLSEAGPWALFRLFARGRWQAGGRPGHLLLTLPLGGIAISYDIRLSGPDNPFAPGLLSGFHCPVVQ